MDTYTDYIKRRIVNQIQDTAIKLIEPYEEFTEKDLNEIWLKVIATFNSDLIKWNNKEIENGI